MSIISVSPELVTCFRHEGVECPRCDGSGYRPRKRCAGCGEPAGSISAGTGYPLAGMGRDKNGPMYHVNCRPETRGAFALLADLERMGG